jgi:hypothetical protein
MKKNTEGRVHILKLTAKNVKTLRAVEIDEFGEVLEIRGDTGQGKTSILEAIEAGLVGMDAAMVRRGADSAEIMLELDNVRINRIIRGDGRKEVLTVTDRKSGKPVDKAKEFLRALCPDTTLFRPLEFVMLGGGDARGRTERLRQQRNMLLDAMPVSLELTDVAKAMEDLGEDAFREGCGVSLDGVDWNQHGLAVCASLERVFYDARKTVNDAATDAEGQAKHTPAPSRPAPKATAAECRATEERTQRELYQAQAESKSQAGTMARRSQLEAAIATDSKELPALEDLVRWREEKLREGTAAATRIEELKREITKLEAEKEQAREDIFKIDEMRARHRRIQANRAELEQIAQISGGPTVNLPALEAAYREATENRKARELQDAHDAAATKALQARGRAKAFDLLVTLFRDVLPARIVETMKMPVEGLGVEDGIVVYKGIPLHQLGTSEQLRIAVLLAAAINPQTGFVLIDRAESLGSKDRKALADAARELNLQLVLTYVDPLATPCAGRVVMSGGEEVKSA